MKFIKILICLLVFQASAQQGGMWIPSLLEGMNEKEMTALGSKMTAKDIDNWDSLTHMLLIAKIEEKFSIKFNMNN